MYISSTWCEMMNSFIFEIEDVDEMILLLFLFE